MSPFVMWAAVRYGEKGASGAILAVSLTCAGMSRQQGSRTMTSTLPRRLLQLLLGGVAAFSLVVPSSAEELRIGYVAPITGIFAQVGKDMIDGFQLYLDEVNSDFGGAKVKFSRPPTRPGPFLPCWPRFPA